MTSFLDTAKPLSGRVAIITGSGRNIGRSVALGLARAGASMVLNGHRNEAALKQVASEVQALGGEAMTYIADVSKPDQINAMVKATVERFGGVDIAVSNVGLRMRQAFLDISHADWQQVMETNLSAAF